VKIIDSSIHDVKIIVPNVFHDSRGSFFESFNQKAFEAAGINAVFVQDNQSESSKNVLRGLHFQKPPFEQGKLVRVVNGAVLDVVVDMRKYSPTFGKYFSCELNTINKHLLWVPPGLAHGFITLTDNTIFVYKCTNFYNKPSESGIRWNDPDLAIDWGVNMPLVSEKDAILPFWKDLI
jgi:dTDP-4-dehydrorhamnose 3,5-epimerase